jgi:hypothetical protein
MPKGTVANKKTVKPTTKPVMKTLQNKEAEASNTGAPVQHQEARATGPLAPKQQEKKQEPNTMLYSNEVVQALLDHFTRTPHVMAEVEGLVNALRNGVPVVYNQEKQA